MTDDARLQRMEETLGQIHRTVVAIEVNHGEKIQALADGLAVNNARLDAVDQRLDRLEKGQEAAEKRLHALEKGQQALEKGQQALEKGQQALEKGQQALEGGQQALHEDIREIKRAVGLLHSIASDHETRLQRVENDLRDHLTRHP